MIRYTVAKKNQLGLLDFSHFWLHRNLYGGFNIFIHKLYLKLNIYNIIFLNNKPENIYQKNANKACIPMQLYFVKENIFFFFAKELIILIFHNF